MWVHPASLKQTHIVPIEHPCEYIQQVFNKHTNHDNSGNNIGRQVQFTSEVTPIGVNIVFKLQPNPTIID